HGIYDLAGNRFDELGAGAAWSYTLADTITPKASLISPTPGALIRSLTQIEVNFSESVIGVNAADLLVNGQPAATMTGGGSGPYLFSFTQPANGAVAISWAGGHGIVDTAPAPNAFGGGSWSYTLDPAAPADV